MGTHPGTATIAIGLVIPLVSLLGDIGTTPGEVSASDLGSNDHIAHMRPTSQSAHGGFSVWDRLPAERLDGAVRLSALHAVAQRSRSDSGDVWVTVEGVVPFTDDMTILDARRRSKHEARRKAVEQAVGVFVKGNTIIYNSVLAEDLVQSVVRGLIVEEEVVSEGSRDITISRGEKGVLYVTTLKARVRPVPGGHKGTLAIKAILNKQLFSRNEAVEIEVVLSEDAYLYIFNISDDDSVTVLFPNRITPANRVTGQRAMKFPGPELHAQGFQLRAVPPPSKMKAMEKLKFIATKQPINFRTKTFHEALFQAYTGNETGLVKDLLAVLSRLEEDEWAETTIPYEIVSN